MSLRETTAQERAATACTVPYVTQWVVTDYAGDEAYVAVNHNTPSLMVWPCIPGEGELMPSVVEIRGDDLRTILETLLQSLSS